MFQRAVFALPDQRRAGQDDREHRDIVDQLHHRTEPGLGQIRVEPVPGYDFGRQCRRPLAAVYKRVDFIRHDLLDIAAPGERLRHARRIDVQLKFRTVSGQHVLLEIVWNHQYERVVAAVHARVDFRA